MLEVLPPIRWEGRESVDRWNPELDTESFMLSERTYGNITAIFCRIGERYFEMQDSIFLTYEAIIAKCQKEEVAE